MTRCGCSLTAPMVSKTRRGCSGLGLGAGGGTARCWSLGGGDGAASRAGTSGGASARRGAGCGTVTVRLMRSARLGVPLA